MNKISANGLYNLPEDFYHGDSAIGPSLSSSGALTLVEECPARYWFSSYLNPDREPEEHTDAMDFGTAVHTAILEPELWAERVVIVAKDNWKTNEAQNARIKARAEGRVALLAKHAERVSAISTAVARHPLAGKAFTGGLAERSLFWHDPDTGVWCKARPDYLRPGQIIQLKTAPSAHPRAFERHAYDQGYFQRAAWECEVAVNALGLKDWPEYFIVCQERDPPYLVSVCKVHERAIEVGLTMNAKAREVFAECVASGRWPGYADKATIIGLPSYAEFQLETRREAGEFSTKVSAKAMKIAAEMQAPLGA